MKKLLILVVCIFFVTPCYAKDLYLAYNLWIQRDGATCLNYKTGKLVPAGAKVADAKVNTQSDGLYAYEDYHYEPEISFKYEGKKVKVKFSGKYHPGKKIQDYFDTMFVDKPVEQRVTDPEVRQAIIDGHVIVGMTKEEVLMSYGYPPEHKTPSLDSNEWMYWVNRFKRKKICFDNDGKAASCKVVQKNVL